MGKIINLYYNYKIAKKKKNNNKNKINFICRLIFITYNFLFPINKKTRKVFLSIKSQN